MGKTVQVIVALAALLTSSGCVLADPVSVDVTVVDQNGRPIEDALVYARFRYHTKDDLHKEKTNESGEVSFLDASPIWVGVTVKKDGFYQSVKEVGGHENSSVTIRMREKRNPSPMYVKQMYLRLPERGQRLGFDFKEGDWVDPHGEGRRAHIFFRMTGAEVADLEWDATLKVTFPDQKGGIKMIESGVDESEFKFPYKAPKEGYRTTLTHEFYKKIGGLDEESELQTTLDGAILGYIFQIPIEVDENGRIITATYGKIVDEFEFKPAKKSEETHEGYVRFRYYYNPRPGSRSLEFDPKRNLFNGVEKSFPP